MRLADRVVGHRAGRARSGCVEVGRECPERAWAEGDLSFRRGDQGDAMWTEVPSKEEQKKYLMDEEGLWNDVISL